jgi:hypothetical protein
MTSQQFDHAPLGMEPLSGPGAMMGMSGASTQPLMMGSSTLMMGPPGGGAPSSSSSSSTALYNGSGAPIGMSTSAPGAAAEMSALHSLALSYARKLDIAVRSGSEDDTALLLCEPLLNPNIKVRMGRNRDVGFFFFTFFFFFFFFFR